MRVRAKCDTDEDTTVKAWLLADNIDQRLCLLNDVKNRMGYATDDVSDDEAIESIITGMTGRFEAFCKRKLLKASSDVTEYHRGYKNIFISIMITL